MITFKVHVHPASSQQRVGGSHDGNLVVRVRAKAVDGAATDEVLTVVAAAFSVRPGRVTCVRGHHSRTKVIAIEGEHDALDQRFRELLA